MSINVIIVAVLALIVLVVLLFIFNSKINIFGSGVSACNGVCKPAGTSGQGYDACDETNGFTHSIGGDGYCKKNQPGSPYCCIQAIKTTQ